MQTWIVPFIYLAVMLGIYLFGPRDRRATIQEAARGDLNYYILCDLALVALSIVATLTYRPVWLDYVAWGALAVLGGLSARKIWQGKPDSEIPSDKGPL